MNDPASLLWACPVCQAPLIGAAKQWTCSNNHCFDRSKSGYTNLLLANQKFSKEPGDSRQMLLARREFLEHGHFLPIVEAVAFAINTHRKTKPDNQCLLDIGCGEGYYLRNLAPALAGSWSIAGLDIAKEGIQLAAKRDPRSSTWVCASSTRIPVVSETLDVMLRVFAPSDAAEAARVLKNDGLIVAVSPAARHLIEIKKELYDKVTLHAPPAVPAGFKTVDERQLEFTIRLTDGEQVGSLLRMTPFYWRGDKKGRDHLLARQTLEVTIAVWISCYRKI